jgi:hypothetical protein
MGPVFVQNNKGGSYPMKDAYSVRGVSDVVEWTAAEKVAFYQRQLASLQAAPQVVVKK